MSQRIAPVHLGMLSTMPGIRIFPASASLLLALGAMALLSSCAASGGDMVADLTTSPGKYMLYKCPALKQAAQGIANRQHELEQLMQKAGTGAGRLVSATTYKPEYIQNQSNLNEIRREAAAKQCHDFVPGVDDVYHAPPVAKPSPKKPPHKAKKP